MIAKFLDYFRDPQDQEPSFLRMTRNILIFTIVATLAIMVLVSGVLQGLPRNNIALYSLGITAILEGISLYLTVRGKPGMAKILVPLSLFVAVFFIASSTFGLHDISIIGLPVIIIIGTFLNGRRAGILITPIAIATVLIIGIIDLNGIKTYRLPQLAEKTGVDDVAITVVLMIVSSVILQTLVNRLQEAIKKARANELAEIEVNRELRTLQTTLEQRVAERTEELNQANQRIERRVHQLEAITRIAQATTQVEEIDLLLPRLAKLISEHLGHYHTGVFLLDDAREYAALRASNSLGGAKMLERGHRLRVGQTGLVGFVAAAGTPRIALDVGADAVSFDNPDLPHTRSEIALPMFFAKQIIGVLDIQSTETNAFAPEDIGVLSTLADQVSVAIQNARSMQETKRLLAESQSAVGGYITEAWKVLQARSQAAGYSSTAGSTVKPLEKPLEGNHIRLAVEKGETVTLPDCIAIPIRLRGQVIGVMNLRTSGSHKWTSDETDIAEAIADRLSLAIETSTLLQASQHRANIERITADISGKIGSSTRIETILQTAAQELSRALGGSDVLVQIEPVAMKMNSSA